MEASYHLLHNSVNTSCKENNITVNSSNSNSSNNISNMLNNVNGGGSDTSSDADSLIDNIKKKLIIETCNGIQEKSKILQIHNKPAESEFSENIKSLYTTTTTTVKKITHRVIPSAPERILDAPEFKDDYCKSCTQLNLYCRLNLLNFCLKDLNLLDWSSNNYLAVALNKEMYLWNASGGDITQLMSMDDGTSASANDYISSTAWIQDKGHVLAVGNSKSAVELWDVNRQVCIRNMKSHTSRVGCLSWNQHILTSGSRAGVIHHHDVRVRQHHVGTLKTHEQEVCGLKWSGDGRHLASGGNDNLVCVWDANMSHESRPLHVFREHSAAVKAVAWCPWQSNILATGGGTADGKIRIWNIYNGSVMQTKDAKSQVSCLIWSKEHKELISSHGFNLNQLTIWRYPEMVKVCDLNGHTNRVLMMAMSPDSEMILSAGADETLRLWKCFGLNDKQKKARETLNIAVKKSASYTSLSRCIR